MPGPVFLDGERIAFRTIEEKDLSFLQRNRNDPEIRRSMEQTTPTTGHEQIARYERRETETSTHLLITTADGATPVGYVSVTELNESWGTAKLSYWVATDEQGNGYGTEATRLIVGYAFDHRRLHKLLAHVFGFNDASIALLESVGFEREGVHRKEAFINGQYWDLLSYGLLEDQWRTP